MSRLRTIALAALLALAIVLAGLYAVHDWFVYGIQLHGGAITASPTEHGIARFERVAFRSADGTCIKALWFPAPRADPRTVPTVIMYHGVYTNMFVRLPVARRILQAKDCNVLMVSYRGYSGSEGRPSEGGLRLDAQAALDYLHVRRAAEIDKSRIVLLGNSLGGAAAIDLASREGNQGKFSGLILENTFLNIARIIEHRVPGTAWVRISELGADTALPILFLSGDRDGTVPPQHMTRLYSLAKSSSEPLLPRDHVRFSTIQGRGHTNTDDSPKYFKKIAEFLDAL